MLGFVSLPKTRETCACEDAWHKSHGGVGLVAFEESPDVMLIADTARQNQIVLEVVPATILPVFRASGQTSDVPPQEVRREIGRSGKELNALRIRTRAIALPRYDATSPTEVADAVKPLAMSLIRLRSSLPVPRRGKASTSRKQSLRG